MTELVRLHIEWCGVRTLELGAFSGLTELAELTIKGNQLSKLTPGTFGNLSKLEYLCILNTELENFDSDVCSVLVNLQYMHLERSKLQSFHPDTFLRLPNIQSEYLNQNPRIQIPTDGSFINSHCLLKPHIPYCNVSSLSVEMICKRQWTRMGSLGTSTAESFEISTHNIPKSSLS